MTEKLAQILEGLVASGDLVRTGYDEAGEPTYDITPKGEQRAKALRDISVRGTPSGGPAK
jgi:predicted transcriptional regulator